MDQTLYEYKSLLFPCLSSRKNFFELPLLQSLGYQNGSYLKIPLHTKNLQDCALQQIKYLTTKSSSLVQLSAFEEDALDDGFVICDLNVIRHKLKAWYTLFPRVTPYFALKCNPDVKIASVLGFSEYTCGFDCASISEISLALTCTAGNTDRIIYANPQRSHTDLRKALEYGINKLTFDDIEELRKVKVAHSRMIEQWKIKKKKGEHLEPPKPPQMILRIVVPDRSATVPLGEKFGASPSRIEYLINVALKMHLPVIGVSFHCGSECKNPHSYGVAIHMAKDAMDMIDSIVHDVYNNNRNYNIVSEFQEERKNVQACTLLDIGGGYPGIDGIGADLGRFLGDNTTNSYNSSFNGANIVAVNKSNIKDENNVRTTKNIANVITPLLDKLFPSSVCPSIGIISEPGRYFVETAFIYCARIYSVRTEEYSRYIEHSSRESTDSHAQIRRHYYIAQGVQGIFKDVNLCGKTFNPIPLKIDHKSVDSDIYTSKTLSRLSYPIYDTTVYGPSGNDFDIVCLNCMLPILNVGDWLLFDRMGAYTLSISSRSSFLPIQYVSSGSF